MVLLTTIQTLLVFICFAVLVHTLTRALRYDCRPGEAGPTQAKAWTPPERCVFCNEPAWDSLPVLHTRQWFCKPCYIDAAGGFRPASDERGYQTSY